MNPLAYGVPGFLIGQPVPTHVDPPFYEVTATLCGGLFFASFFLAQLILERSASEKNKIAPLRVGGFLFAALVIGTIFFNGMLYSLLELLPPELNKGAVGNLTRTFAVVSLLMPALIFLNRHARSGLSNHLSFLVRRDPLAIPYGIFIWLQIWALAVAISFNNDVTYINPEREYPLDAWVRPAFFIAVGSFVAMLATVFFFFTYADALQDDVPDPRVDAHSDRFLAQVAAGCFAVFAITYPLGTLLPSDFPYIFWFYQVWRWITIIVSVVTVLVLSNRLRGIVKVPLHKLALGVTCALLVYEAVLKNAVFPLPWNHLKWKPWDYATGVVFAIITVIMFVASKRVRADGVSESPVR